jgi:hypothetical protein
MLLQRSLEAEKVNKVPSDAPRFPSYAVFMVSLIIASVDF